MDTSVVWNLDARNRPELEVEIDIVYAPGELPGLHYASARPELEVDMIEVLESEEIPDLTDVVDDLGDPWTDDIAPIFDIPPRGYADAYHAHVA